MKKIKFFAVLFSVLALAMACKPIEDDPIVDSVDKNGSGTEADPYTVAGAMKKGSGEAWVKGFIVGYMSVGDTNIPTFDANTDSIDTNILIADTTANVTVYMAVQLPVGDVRNGVNLVENKDNLNQEVLLYGQIASYFGATGVKGVTYAKIGEKEFGYNPNKPIETEGKGTKEDPYTFADIKKIVSRGTEEAFVKAYIVGQIKGGSQSFNEETAEFAAPFTAEEGKSYNTNILIGATETVSSIADAAPVQLPSGAVRLGLNLIENPEMLGKEVILFGSIEKYFGAPGIKGVTLAYVGDQVFGTEPLDTSGAIFFASFENSIEGFTAVDITKPDGLPNIWTFDSKYKCIKATAYSGGKQNGEGYIVSPSIDLTSASKASLYFENAGNYFVTPSSELTAWISTTSDGTSFDEGWTQLTINNYSTGGFAFVGTTIDLSQYCGQPVRIAFRYVSTPEMCGTWEIRNFLVK